MLIAIRKGQSLLRQIVKLLGIEAVAANLILILANSHFLRIKPSRLSILPILVLKENALEILVKYKKDNISQYLTRPIYRYLRKIILHYLVKELERAFLIDKVKTRSIKSGII